MPARSIDKRVSWGFDHFVTAVDSDAELVLRSIHVFAPENGFHYIYRNKIIYCLTHPYNPVIDSIF